MMPQHVRTVDDLPHDHSRRPGCRSALSLPRSGGSPREGARSELASGVATGGGGPQASYPDSFLLEPQSRGATGNGGWVSTMGSVTQPVGAAPMPPRVLYQRLCQQFLACAPALGVWPRRRLALLVTGLLLARHVALPRVAAQLRRVGGAAHADSIERRLRRTLGVSEFQTAQVFEHVARASLRRLAAGRYLLLLDDTQQTTRCTLSTLALAYGGRALPLAWCRWSGKLHGAYWSQIDQMFDQAGRLLPPQVRPVVVADR